MEVATGSGVFAAKGVFWVSWPALSQRVFPRVLRCTAVVTTQGRVISSLSTPSQAVTKRAGGIERCLIIPSSEETSHSMASLRLLLHFTVWKGWCLVVYYMNSLVEKPISGSASTLEPDFKPGLIAEMRSEHKAYPSVMIIAWVFLNVLFG